MFHEGGEWDATCDWWFEAGIVYKEDGARFGHEVEKDCRKEQEQEQESISLQQLKQSAHCAKCEMRCCVQEVRSRLYSQFVRFSVGISSK